MVSRRLRPIVECMTTTITAGTQCPSLFESALPVLDYGEGLDPDVAHRVIREVRTQAPIGFGPYGPELLDYELVRTMLRDSRFAMPKGIGLVVQGITSGPVWVASARCSSASTLPNTSGFATWSPGRSPRGRQVGCAPRVSR